MANVILFTDLPPRNLGLSETPYYLRYQTKTAGVYGIASHLRRQGFSVLVIDHCASYTLAGVKKIIDSNASDLLWVGISTTFFTTNFRESSPYHSEWELSESLFFEDWLVPLLDETALPKKCDYTKIKRDLIWGSPQINLIADHCEKYSIPLIIGGAWVTNILDGRLVNLHRNAHIITGRAEVVTSNITHQLAKDKNSKFSTVADNTDYDNIDFKINQYCWLPEDNILPDDWLPLQIARGCAFNCAYCDFNRRNNVNSYRNSDSIREELIRNYETFGVTKYILMDDLYNDSKDKVRILHDEVWSQLPFKPEWTSYMRLDMIWADPASAEIIKQSGARLGSFGIETLHDRAGSKVGKGLGKKRILETLEHLKNTWGDDVLVHGYFMAGLPDEPEESILNTIEWAGKTPLLDCVSWQPLWITPPAHREFVIHKSPMSSDNTKYNISWLEDNLTWVNSQGVTFTRAVELAHLGNHTRDFFIGGFGEYPEIRQMGWTHDDIVQLKDKRKESTERLQQDTPKVMNRINTRVKQLVGLV